MVDSRQVLCCGARVWALWIGWLQTILCAICLGLLIHVLIEVAGSLSDESIDELGKDDPEVLEHVRQSIHIIFGLICVAAVILIFGLMAGIFLIVGVKQKNPAKLQVWIVIEWIFVGLSVLELVMKLYFVSPSELFIEPIVSILSSLFFIWVIRVYRQEVLNAGAGAVSYSFVNKP